MARTRFINLANAQQFTAIQVLSDPGASPGKLVIPQAAQVMPVFGLQTGVEARLVLYGSYSGPFSVTPTMVESASAALTSGATWTTLAAFLSAGFSYQRLEVRDVGQPDQPILIGGGATAGTSASPGLPDEVALAIQFQTGFAGRSGRGRAYMPGWATNSLGAGGTVATAAVTALEAWFNADVVAAFSALNMTHALGLRARVAYTGVTGTPHPARAATTRPVTARVVPDNHWDSQRRRGLD